MKLACGNKQSDMRCIQPARRRTITRRLYSTHQIRKREATSDIVPHISLVSLRTASFMVRSTSSGKTGWRADAMRYRLSDSRSLGCVRRY